MQGFCLGAAWCRVSDENEPVQPPDQMAFDHNVAGFVEIRLKRCILAQPAHQDAGAPIDETFGEPFVQGVRQAVFDGAGDALPMFRVAEPIRTVRRKGPGADMGNARG